MKRIILAQLLSNIEKQGDILDNSMKMNGEDTRVKSLVNRSNRIKSFKIIFYVVSQFFMFIATSVVFVDLIYSWNTEIIITYLFYLLFAIVGGGSYGMSMVNYTNTLFTHRNNFFIEYCGISDAWDGKSKKPMKKKFKKS